MAKGYTRLRNLILGWIENHPNIKGTGNYSLTYTSGVYRKDLNPNFGDRYYVSKHGRVFRRIKHLSLWVEISYKIRIDARKRHNKSPTISIRVKVHGELTQLSRLVAKVGVHNPDPKNYNIVMHLDNDHTNNSAINLQWGTQSMNIRQALRENRLPTLFVSGPSNPSWRKRQSKLSLGDEASIIRDIQSGKYTRVQLSNKWGVSRATLNNVLKRNNIYGKF